MQGSSELHDKQNGTLLGFLLEAVTVFSSSVCNNIYYSFSNNIFSTNFNLAPILNFVKIYPGRVRLFHGEDKEIK
jgi:hypothetical protein